MKRERHDRGLEVRRAAFAVGHSCLARAATSRARGGWGEDGLRSEKRVSLRHPQTRYARGRQRCVLTVDPSNVSRADSRQREETKVSPWELVATLATIQSPWMTIILERLRNHESALLDYWRIERADSLVILTVHRNRLVFPKMQFRPGIGRATLDFPGGRVDQRSLIDTAYDVLLRELGIARSDVDSLQFLNDDNDCDDRGHGSGWLINSSLSNQRLIGGVAVIKNSVMLKPEYLHDRAYRVDDDGNDIRTLLQSELECLQCRAVLMDWWFSTQSR